jgi:hypothetical protein
MFSAIYQRIFPSLSLQTPEQYYHQKFPKLGDRYGTIIDGYNKDNITALCHEHQFSTMTTRERFMRTVELPAKTLEDCETQRSLRDFFSTLRRHTYEPVPSLATASMYSECNDNMFTYDGYYADQLLDHVLQYKGIKRCVPLSGDAPDISREGTPVHVFTPEEFYKRYKYNSG